MIVPIRARPTVAEATTDSHPVWLGAYRGARAGGATPLPGCPAGWDDGVKGDTKEVRENYTNIYHGACHGIYRRALL